MAGDKTYITDDQGKLHRATRVHAVTPTDIVWSSNPNDYSVQVKVGGKWHRAILTMDAGAAQFFDNINIDKGLVIGSDGKTHTALIVKPESTVTLSDIKTDTHGTIAGTTTGETAVSTYSENWSDVKWQDNVNVYKVLVTGSDGKVHTALLTTSAGGGVQVIVLGTSPLVLPDAIANSLSYVKAFGGTEQRNIPQPYTQVNYVTNTAQTAVNTGIMIDFAKNYEFEVECRAVSGSWYILQSRASSSGNITGIHGATSGSTITLVVGNVTVCTSAITRTVGNKLYVKATLNAGTATLYVKDETANTEDTQTGSYGTSQPNPTAAVYLLGNAGGQYVDVNSDIYMARIKENDTVVMDYVPARQVATAGFYDKASGTFKTAETPANLSADGNTVPTPDAPVDIVSNNGALAFRDTELPIAYRRILGMTMDNDCYYEITGFKMSGSDTLRFSFTRTGGNACNVLGTYDGTSVQSNYSLYAGSSSSANYLRYNGGAYNSYAIADKKYDVVITPTGSDGMENDSTWTAKTFTSTTNLCIGTTSPSAASSKMVGSIHGSVVVDGRLELIPCERISDGKLGYYDTNTGTFYEPIGTTPTSLGYDYTKCDIVAAGPVETIEDTIDNTATTEMLLKVGDYQDVQSIIDGAITRNVGVKVLDGTERWVVAAGTDNAYLQVSELPGVKTNSPVLCSHLINSSSGVPRIQLTSVLRVYGIGTEWADKANFQSWLADQYAAGTPVIIIYPLATPTTESVAGQTLQVQDGDNTLEITQASLTGLELEAQYIKVV